MFLVGKDKGSLRNALTTDRRRQHNLNIHPWAVCLVLLSQADALRYRGKCARKMEISDCRVAMHADLEVIMSPNPDTPRP